MVMRIVMMTVMATMMQIKMDDDVDDVDDVDESGAVWWRTAHHRRRKTFSLPSTLLCSLAVSWGL
jgi:hypothetical protein